MILTANRFSFRIREKTLLEKISFEIQAGERIAVIGPNGAGKSTLLKSICRILPPGEGELTVGGKSLADYSQKELARWIIVCSPSNQSQ